MSKRIFIIGHTGADLDSLSATIGYKELLDKTKRYDNAEIVPLAPHEPNVETKHVFKRFGVELPKTVDEIDIKDEDRFILVDHNEKAQRSEKVKNDRVIEIIDHHKININFTSPIHIDVRPFGSTSTIIHELYEKSGIKPSKNVAALMLASILSDTVGLKSPTTTGIDSSVAQKLAEELGLDINEFTFDIFKAKSDISDLTMEEVVTNDYKIFDFDGTKVFIGIVETVEQNEVLKKKEEIAKALNEAKTKLGASQGYLVVQDILELNSKVIYETEEEKKILEKAFVAKEENGIIDIGPKISRKKEIAPAIETAIIK